jgi:Flp pilus assembly pilin Flp
MKFLRDHSGATSIEYALIAGTIFLAVVAGYPLVATAVGAALGRVLPGLE